MANGNSTITDVARQAAVSIKTVSRVVNNEPNVRPETRERVEAVIKALDYRPHPAARGLAGRRSFTIGILYENPREFRYLQQLLSGAFEVCNASGYSLLLCPCDDAGDRLVEGVRRFLIQTHVDGVILPAPLADAPALIELLATMDVPFVQIAPKKGDPSHPAVKCNDRKASRELTDHVLDMGHRRIGVIKGDPAHGSSTQRLAGVRDSLRAHGLKLEPKLVRPGVFDFESGKRAAHELLGLAQPPTVIIAGNDEMAAGVIHEANERGVRIPQDLSVVGFDDSPTATHVWPPLTTVRQPIAEMAASATRLLIGAVRGDCQRGSQAPFSCRLVVRSSVAARPS